MFMWKSRILILINCKPSRCELFCLRLYILKIFNAFPITIAKAIVGIMYCMHKMDFAMRSNMRYGLQTVKFSATFPFTKLL